MNSKPHFLSILPSKLREKMKDLQIEQVINKYLADIKRGDDAKLKPLFEIVTGPLTSVARSYLVDKNADWLIVSNLYHSLKLIVGDNADCDGYILLFNAAKDASCAYNEQTRYKYGANMQAPPSDAPDNFAEDLLSKLNGAINRLSDADKDIFDMRYVREMPQKDIAAALHISQAATSQRIAKIAGAIKSYCLSD